QSTRNTVDISKRYVGYSKKVSIPSKEFTSSQPIFIKANHFNEHQKSQKGPSWNVGEEEDEDYEMEDDGEYDPSDQDYSEDEVGDASEVPAATEFDNQAENLVHKRTRGPTKCKAIHARELEKRETIIINEFGQPIQNDKICNQFSSFLGNVARSSKFLPLNYVSWPHVPKEKKLKVM
ncbi:unnamed protein product, partial [Linum tenue]